MKPTSVFPRLPAFRVSRATSLLSAAMMSGILAAPAYPANAQRAEVDSVPNTLPDAPSAVPAAERDAEARQASGGQGENSPKQSKRILGIVPNFRSVPADTKLPPQSVKEKFKVTAEQSFDYSSIVFSAAIAGIDMADNDTPEFHQGAAGYGRYFWHTFVDQTDENFMVQAIVPAITHEDSRYYTLGHGGLPKRVLYAFDRTLITRSDRGGETFNFSEIVGAGAASGISATYYPGSEKTWTKVGQRWLTNVLIDGGTYIFQEVWPDINDKLFHQKG